MAHPMQGGNDAEFLVDQKWKLPAGVSCERCVLQVCPFHCSVLYVIK